MNSLLTTSCTCFVSSFNFQVLLAPIDTYNTFLSLSSHQLLSLCTYLHTTLSGNNIIVRCILVKAACYIKHQQPLCALTEIRMAAKGICVLFCYYLLLASVVSGFTPVTYPAKVSCECGQYDILQDEQLTGALKQIKLKLGSSGYNHHRNSSCQEILYCFPSAPSGYYQITAPNGSLVQVYCDMEGTNCGGEGGWTRVAYVNMSQSGGTCPQGLTQRILSYDSLWQNVGIVCTQRQRNWCEDVTETVCVNRC